MPTPFQVTFNEIDESFSIATIAKGITAFMGKFLRGPIGVLSEVIYNWNQHKRIYGGFLNDSDAPLICYRAYNAGANLRILRAGHYADITHAASLTATLATLIDSQKLLINGALEAGHSTTITINGTPYVIDYNASNDATLQAIAAAISANSDVQSATVSLVTGGTTDDRAIVVIPASASTLTITGTITNVALSKTLAGASADTGNNDAITFKLAGDETGVLIEGFQVKLSASTGLHLNSATFTAGTTNLYIRNVAYDSDNDITTFELWNVATAGSVSVNQVTAATAAANTAATATLEVSAVSGPGGEYFPYLKVGNVNIFTDNVPGFYVSGPTNVSNTAQQIVDTINAFTGDTGFSATKQSGGNFTIIGPVSEGGALNTLVADFGTISPNTLVIGTNNAFSGGVTGTSSFDPTGITITDTTAPPARTVTVSDVDALLTNGLIKPFNIALKYEGADYNNIRIEIGNATNGSSDYFNLTVSHLTDISVLEIYENLNIPGNPAVSAATYLSKVQSDSTLIDATYNDLSGTTGQQRPMNGIYVFAGGSNGGAIAAIDYIGDESAGTGLHGFSTEDDMLQISIPEITTTSVSQAIIDYATKRKDVCAWVHLDGGNGSVQAYLNEVSAIGKDSSYYGMYAGWILVTDPLTGANRYISEIGDIAGLAAVSDNLIGEWASYAGLNRGNINSTLGVKHNFGSSAKSEELKALSNARINFVIRRTSNNVTTTVLWGNFTGQLAPSSLSFMNVRRLVLMIKKSLKPTLERFLQEPNVPDTWLRLYLITQPFGENLMNVNALVKKTGWRWQGDQFANVPADYEVNDPGQVQLGHYKVKLFLEAVAAIGDIDVGITMSKTGGVQFTN